MVVISPPNDAQEGEENSKHSVLRAFFEGEILVGKEGVEGWLDEFEDGTLKDVSGEEEEGRPRSICVHGWRKGSQSSLFGRV